MSTAPQRLTIATRESPLALWQAEFIRDRLVELYPDTEIIISGMTTRGDQILDKTLSKIGGKGLFVKELETALIEGRADLAVHSSKDIPMVLPEGFAVAAFCQRANPLDAFVSHRFASVGALSEGAVVGTSSLRREAQLRARFPYLDIRPLRGNIQTRLRKLDEGEFDAIILAAAGLERMNLHSRIRSLISAEDSLPAAGQGALGIEIAAHRTDVAAWLAPLNHAPTASCVIAERALARALDGSCRTPLAAFAEETNGIIRLRGLVATTDGHTVLRAQAEAPAEHADALGRAVAQQLQEQGAADIIHACLAD